MLTTRERGGIWIARLDIETEHIGKAHGERAGARRISMGPAKETAIYGANARLLLYYLTGSVDCSLKPDGRREARLAQRRLVE
jgi:hypothetical protein